MNLFILSVFNNRKKIVLSNHFFFFVKFVGKNLIELLLIKLRIYKYVVILFTKRCERTVEHTFNLWSASCEHVLYRFTVMVNE